MKMYKMNYSYLLLLAVIPLLEDKADGKIYHLVEDVVHLAQYFMK
jgi:hypothetical protein